MSGALPIPRPELAGWMARELGVERAEPLSGDASTRAFFRIRPAEGPTRVVMDYGEPFSGETDDVRLARVLETAGLPVAGIVAVAPEPGCLVLEDLGDRTLQREVEARAEQGADLTEPYNLAVDLIAAVATRGSEALAASDRAEGPALDSDRFRFEMDFFVEHWAATTSIGMPSLVDALYSLADLAARTPRRVLCHRDYHSRNLMVREDGALAMVDIQDARWGPDTYDLASLLRDAYVDLPDPLVDEMVLRAARGLGEEAELAAFRRRFDTVAAQRMIKALGTFGFQLRTHGREVYRPAARRTTARLRELLPLGEETAELLPILESAGLLDDDRVTL